VTDNGEHWKTVVGRPCIKRQCDRITGPRKVVFQLKTLFVELVQDPAPKSVSVRKRKRDARDVTKYPLKILILNDGKGLLRRYNPTKDILLQALLDGQVLLLGTG
jgi:hypothetical protein